MAEYSVASYCSYAFDRSKVGPVRAIDPIPVSSGQLAYEWRHLLAKLAVRNPAVFARWRTVAVPACHPLFHQQAGPVAAWERTSGGAGHALRF